MPNRVPPKALAVAQRNRSKRKRHHGRKPISAQNAQPLPAEKCLNQFEYAEFSAKTTFLKAGQPARPQCVHADRGRPTARISVFYLKVCY